jgi:antitoxin (DNA-binding transcriptional repressor) of toxin-antitoxin stability system
MTKINLHEIKSRLSHYARLVKAGETLILCDRNKPFAEIRPLPDPTRPRPKRELGVMKGWFPVPDDFNTPDSEWEEALSESPLFPHLEGRP